MRDWTLGGHSFARILVKPAPVQHGDFDFEVPEWSFLVPGNLNDLQSFSNKEASGTLFGISTVENSDAKFKSIIGLAMLTLLQLYHFVMLSSMSFVAMLHSMPIILQSMSIILHSMSVVAISEL